MWQYGAIKMAKPGSNQVVDIHSHCGGQEFILFLFWSCLGFTDTGLQEITEQITRKLPMIVSGLWGTGYECRNDQMVRSGVSLDSLWMLQWQGHQRGRGGYSLAGPWWTLNNFLMKFTGQPQQWLCCFGERMIRSLAFPDRFQSGCGSIPASLNLWHPMNKLCNRSQILWEYDNYTFPREVVCWGTTCTKHLTVLGIYHAHPSNCSMLTESDTTSTCCNKNKSKTGTHGGIFILLSLRGCVVWYVACVMCEIWHANLQPTDQSMEYTLSPPANLSFPSSPPTRVWWQMSWRERQLCNCNHKQEIPPTHRPLRLLRLPGWTGL